jgi:hypothetical protein
MECDNLWNNCAIVGHSAKYMASCYRICKEEWKSCLGFRICELTTDCVSLRIETVLMTTAVSLWQNNFYTRMSSDSWLATWFFPSFSASVFMWVTENVDDLFRKKIYTCSQVMVYSSLIKVFHSPTYLLTPWSRVLLEKLTGLQLVKKFPAFYGTRRFLTALTIARHLSLSWASPIQSSHPHPTSWRSILTLSSHLRPGLPSGLFPSGFPTRTLYGRTIY